MAKNKYKTESNKAKKKEKGSKSFKNPFSGLSSFKPNERVRKLTGLSMILLSFYFLVAFTSFLFTWKEDQDKLNASWSDILFNTNLQVENWLGKLGALVSHQFIHEWFGVSSFLFVLLIFITGFRIFFKTNLLPIKKTYAYSLFSIVWISLFLGYFFDSSYHFLGGSFGYQINLWLDSILGAIGTGLFIIFTLLGFLIINFNISLMLKKQLFFVPGKSVEENKPDEEEAGEETTSKEDDSEEEVDTSSPVLETNTANLDHEVPENTDTEESTTEPQEKATEDEESKSIDLDTDTGEPNEKDESDDKDDVGFSYEENKGDEELSDDEVNKKVEEFGEYDPTLDLSSYQLPSIDILEQHGSSEISVNKEELEANKNRIVQTLENYNIKIKQIKATIGPTITLYEIVPAPGVRISKIKNLEDDIALSLSALGIRIIAPIPGRGTIGIEVPNQNPEIVSMRSVIKSDKFQNSKMELPVALGKTISNETFVADLTSMPHLLMAGATGQGKSVGLNAILTSLLYKKHPSQLKFVLVDPKKVELTLFTKIERHFLAKLPDSEEAIITDNDKVVKTLNSLCVEMDQRYELLKDAMVRNIKEYNQKFIDRKLNPENGHKFLPYIVLVVDEFADLIMTAGKEVEQPIARLAQLARAIGIHLIIATQRPSTNIITGIIKANFPARIAFRVTSQIDSRTILDSGGAEQLIGRGDMLLSSGSTLTRLQCAFIDTPEVDDLTEFIGNQKAYPEAFKLPEYVDESSGSSGGLDDDEKDDLFEDAARVIVQHQQGSASLLQRRLKLGYNRAGRIIDQLESAGIVGPFEGSKARQVLIADEQSLEQFLEELS